ncbi:hypothetical protein, conserved [Eimeria tenella]|uniref:Uncharacterized protein n=1 Tax=Eimeria tenella TaxID=5802 RepID=U6KRE5_EIMTE|nr:hypothetical protein, conserved [Eimeria tenella]CDJ40541.1 hypothetical protein, conserved [Eimeria tenella]|eukprot:XP_013231291.1 hypothetical protein, conserved [Eimeria tenella]
MDLLLRLFAFVAALIFDSSASTRYQFGFIRVACIAVDAITPFFIAGEAAKPRERMSDQNFSTPRSDERAYQREEQHSFSAHEPGDHFTEAQQTWQHSLEPPATDPPSNREGANSSPGSLGGVSNQSTLNDLRKHGTQMTKEELKQAEEILKTKYGAIDTQEKGGT